MQPYAIVMPATSLSAAKDLIRVSAPSSAGLVLLRASITQRDSETSSQASAVIKRVSTDGTGTANTPEDLEPLSPAFPGTAVHNLTADATISGGPLYVEGFNLLNGWLYVPTPDERIVVAPSARLVLRLDSAPAAAAEITALLVVGVVG